MSWRAATKALYEAGGGPLRRMDFWPPHISGQARTSSMTRAANLGLMERCNKGYVWRWELTPKGRDWCEGRIPDPTAKVAPQIDREEVLRRMTFGVDDALSQVWRLTARQREVLVYVAKGMTSKEAAKALGLEHATVEMHRRKIFSRLGITRATEMAVLAAKAGLV